MFSRARLISSISLARSSRSLSTFSWFWSTKSLLLCTFLAARNVQSSRDFVDQNQEKVERLRLERAREMEEMRRARENITEEDYVVSNERSEATRELEAFRASRGGGAIRDRYNPDTEPQHPAQSRSQTFTKAPKMRAKAGDNWMKNSSQEKAEAARGQLDEELEPGEGG